MSSHAANFPTPMHSSHALSQQMCGLVFNALSAACVLSGLWLILVR